jgi:hypothetical protein
MRNALGHLVSCRGIVNRRDYFNFFGQYFDCHSLCDIREIGEMRERLWVVKRHKFTAPAKWMSKKISSADHLVNARCEFLSKNAQVVFRQAFVRKHIVGQD